MNVGAWMSGDVAVHLSNEGDFQWGSKHNVNSSSTPLTSRIFVLKMDEEKGFLTHKLIKGTNERHHK